MLSKLPLCHELITLHEAILVVRPTFARWSHHLSVRCGSGWNPLSGKLYIHSDSLVLALLTDPGLDARSMNGHDDRLVREAFSLCHDFLHLVATAWILETVPAELFQRPLTAENIEQHAFLLIVAEAIAVVGLDYWFLSRGSHSFLDELGARQKHFAVSYSAHDLDEYHRFNTQWNPDTPSFLGKLINFYASGRFKGFAIRDVQRSPKLHDWLSHELQYGQTQRIYARQWLHHMAGLVIDSSLDPGRPIEVSEPWMLTLVTEVGERLWSVVRQNSCSGFVPFETPSAFAGLATAPDQNWKFSNAGAFGRDAWLSRKGDQESLLVDQLVQLTPFPADPVAVNIVRESKSKLGADFMAWLLGQLGLVHEPVEAQAQLFFPR